MTAEEFVKKYVLHDSLIDGVYVDNENGKVTMEIDFAFWMQEGYEESDPETGMVNMIFDGVNYVEIPQGVDWSEISISEARIDGDMIKFELMNDVTDDYLEILISAQNVSLETIDCR